VRPSITNSKGLINGSCGWSRVERVDAGARRAPGDTSLHGSLCPHVRTGRTVPPSRTAPTWDHPLAAVKTPRKIPVRKARRLDRAPKTAAPRRISASRRAAGVGVATS